MKSLEVSEEGSPKEGPALERGKAPNGTFDAALKRAPHDSGRADICNVSYQRVPWPVTSSTGRAIGKRERIHSS